jgi:hypothetical protein
MDKGNHIHSTFQPPNMPVLPKHKAGNDSREGKDEEEEGRAGAFTGAEEGEGKAFSGLGGHKGLEDAVHQHAAQEVADGDGGKPKLCFNSTIVFYVIEKGMPDGMPLLRFWI